MSDALAVVIGAAIAFVGSVIGSILAPYVVARLERRRRQDDRRSEEDQRHRDALKRLLDDLREGSADLSETAALSGSWTPATAALRLVHSASLQLELELRPDEDALSLPMQRAVHCMYNPFDSAQQGRTMTRIHRALALWQGHRRTLGQTVQEIDRAVDEWNAAESVRRSETPFGSGTVAGAAS